MPMALFLRPFLIAITALILTVCDPVRAQPPGRREQMEDAHTVRLMSMAVMTYAQAHDGGLPPDMASMFEYIAGDPKGTPADRIAAIRKTYLSSVDKGIKIPDDAGPQWAGEHTSYAYIGVEGLKMEDLAGWESLAIVHQKLDKGCIVEQNEDNPEGRTFNIAFLDGHTEAMGRAQAEQVIAESTAIFEALRTGGPLPDSQQMSMDIKAIIAAIGAYAKAHNDDMPPDLGATLEYLPPEKFHPKKPVPKAAVYLSPAAKKSTHIPEDATPEWVNTHTSYTYLGAAGAALSKIEDPQHTVLLHGRLDSPIDSRVRGFNIKGYPIATAWAEVQVADEKYARWIIDISKRVVESAKTGAPLPDHLNTLRDVRLLTKAILAYAKAHKNEMPPDLGATLEYLDPALSPKDKALIYLTPKAERSTGLPDELTPEWINKRANYTYLGGPGIDAKLAREAGVQLILHGPPDETYTILIPGGEFLVVAEGIIYDMAYFEPPESLLKRAAESKELLDALKAAPNH